VKDLAIGALSLVSTAATGAKADDSAGTPTISGDGRRVAFSSYATNLTPEPPAGRQLDVYVKDLETGDVADASRLGPQEPSGIVSTYPALPDHRARVVFASNATGFTPADTNGLADVYLTRLHQSQR
jgi:hypothetical protein